MYSYQHLVGKVTMIDWAYMEQQSTQEAAEQHQARRGAKCQHC